MNKFNNKTKGAFGEKIAAQYLQKAGYEIVETNFRYSRFSEIDIIAKHKDTLVFVEVKYRSNSDYGHPFEAVDKKKLSRIWQTAQFYLQTHPHKKYRIDVISVLGSENSKIEHIKNISFF